MTDNAKPKQPGAEPAAESASPSEGGWMETLARVAERWVPDSLTMAIILMVVLAAASLALGNTVAETTDAYYKGLWMLLAFTMQMTLILTLSLVLAETPLFKRGVVRLSRLPRTPAQVIIGAIALTALLSYANWGLSLALSPMIAVHFCRRAEEKGLRVDFVWMMAVLAGAGSIWQLGLSATAPLQMTSDTHFLAETTKAMPLSSTIWSPAAIVMVVAFLAATAIVGVVFMPKRARQISEFPESNHLAELVASGEIPAAPEPQDGPSLALKVERSPFTLIPLWFALGVWLFHHFISLKASLDINSMVTILLLAGLVCHRTVANFTASLQRVITSAWPVVVMYHLYAGVAGLIQFTNVGKSITDLIAPIATPYTLPLLTAAVSTVIAIFIPTSGGQWQIQGYVTITTAQAAGISAQRNLLALSIGDHMGNLISPFWTVVGAGIAKVDFRLIFGYRLIFAALWFVMGVVIFTFLPC